MGSQRVGHNLANEKQQSTGLSLTLLPQVLLPGSARVTTSAPAFLPMASVCTVLCSWQSSHLRIYMACPTSHSSSAIKPGRGPSGRKPTRTKMSAFHQVRILEWVVFPLSRGSSQHRIEPGSPALQVESLPAELPGKPASALLVDNVHLC